MILLYNTFTNFGDVDRCHPQRGPADAISNAQHSNAYASRLTPGSPPTLACKTREDRAAAVVLQTEKRENLRKDRPSTIHNSRFSSLGPVPRQNCDPPLNQ
jgi:hypothetical protein